MMRWSLRFLGLAVLLTLYSGCTAADKAQWNEAMKDLRGENMEMGSRRTQVP
jgi:hypothetical protein